MHESMGHTSNIRDAMTVAMLTDGAPTKVTGADLLAYYRIVEDVDFVPGTS